jgi:hypothetical protein
MWPCPSLLALFSTAVLFGPVVEPQERPLPHGLAFPFALRCRLRASEQRNDERRQPRPANRASHRLARVRGEPLSQSAVCGTVTGSDRAYGSAFPYGLDLLVRFLSTTALAPRNRRRSSEGGWPMARRSTRTRWL